MLKVLIVEDSQQKAAQIAKAVAGAGVPQAHIFVVPDVLSARTHLLTGGIGLLILDILIPKRYDMAPTGADGHGLLRWILRRDGRVKVGPILVLSAYEPTPETGAVLTEYGVPFVKYEQSGEDWRRFVAGFTRRLVQASDSGGDPGSAETYQVAVLTAVEVELEAARRVFHCNTTPKIRGAESWYSGATNATGDSPVVVAQSAQMGMPAAATLTANAIHTWSPRILIMTGICAGVRGGVELGDLIVADPSWDYGSGKMTAQNILQPDLRQIPLTQRIRTLVRSLKDSPELRQWWQQWLGAKPLSEPRVLLVPAASGAAVVQSKEITQSVVSQTRKVLALDMETYGLYFAASHLGVLDFVSIKAVVDFADPEKNDAYHHYGAEMSARFAALLSEAWIREYGSS